MKVLLGSRDEGRGKAAVQQLADDPDYEEAVKQGRLELFLIDTADPKSVNDAANRVTDNSLFGLVNNAGVAWVEPEETLKVNYWGVQHVCDAFLSKIIRPDGRIVMTSSAAGPMYVSKLSDSDPVKEKLSKPWTLHGVDELDMIAKNTKVEDSGDGPPNRAMYGFSKALLNCYTYLLSRKNPDLHVNAMTPGFILTDLTKSLGATKTPWEGAQPALHLLFDEKVIGLPPSQRGRFYGSDCKRSPIDKYRDPGEPEYDGPDGP